jgi:hypothetical protein
MKWFPSLPTPSPFDSSDKIEVGLMIEVASTAAAVAACPCDNNDDDDGVDAFGVTLGCKSGYGSLLVFRSKEDLETSSRRSDDDDAIVRETCNDGVLVDATELVVPIVGGGGGSCV